ncbi:MAG: HNH endonuclease [Isosphaeraceae bacterium]
MCSDVLRRPTLVLNRSWQPVHVTTVIRGLTLLWTGAARVLDPHDFRLLSWHEWTRLAPGDEEPVIRSATARIRVPEVLCLVRYERRPQSAVSFSRRNVARRDHFTCQYCGAQPGGSAITIDHVLPRSRGGATSWTNCVAACVACNTLKADRTPEQAGLTLRRRPVRPSWKPHYVAYERRPLSWQVFVSAETEAEPAGLVSV